MISWLAYISFLFLSLRFMVVLVNFFFHLGRPRNGSPVDETISILIPARNEEKNIGRILDCILNQDYTNFEVVVCDDHSSDRTPAILEEYSKLHKEVKWIRGETLPPGWTGKNFACYQLAAKANGEILLFVDADVEIHGNIISSMQGYMKKRKLALLSIFPRQLMRTTGERASVPVMNWILLSLLPLPMVFLGLRSSFTAANGQFMMFRAHVYQKLQPHAIVRASPVEDIEIMKLYKKAFYRCATLLGDHRVQCRMYASYREAIAGFSKNVLHFFSGSLLWMFFFMTLTTFGLVFIGIWNLHAFLLALAVSVISRLLISLMSHQQVLNNLLLVPAQQISFLWMVKKALAQKSKGSLLWKGREIPVK